MKCCTLRVTYASNPLGVLPKFALVFLLLSISVNAVAETVPKSKGAKIPSWRIVRKVNLPSIQGSIDEIAFSRHGKVAALRVGGKLTLFNTPNWKPLHTFGANLDKTLNQFALSPDGKSIAIVRYKLGNEWSLRHGISLEVCHAHTGKRKKLLFNSDKDNYVLYSPDGKTLVTLSNYVNPSDNRFIDKTLGCWDALTGRLKWRVYSRETNSASAFDPMSDETSYGPIYYSSGLAFTNDGRTLATEVNGIVELYDAHSGKKRLRISDKRGVEAPLVFSRDDKTLASSGDLGSYGWNNGPDESAPYHATALYGIKFWNVETGKLQANSKPTAASNSSSYIFTPIAFWPNRDTLLSLSYSVPATPVLFNAKTGAEIFRQETQLSVAPVGIAVAPNAKSVVIASDDNGKSVLTYWTNVIMK